jgi:septal ring factor EnvC (AmiA/AmiB activator)
VVKRVAILACVLTVLPAPPVETREGQGAAAQRVAERLRDLSQEAAALNNREQTLLNELRKLELERQIKSEELMALGAEVRAIQEQLAAATVRAETLRRSAEAERPEIHDRLVRLYKMGPAGYWRLLLDIDDVQSMGRAYRTAAALTHLDRDRVQQHGRTLVSLDHERQSLETRAKDLGAMQQKAAVAQLALGRAVASRSALMKSIEERRDLAAQLAKELEAADQRLQTATARPGAAPVLVPVRPFRGGMPWPAEGIVVGRFGRQQVGRMAGIDVSRNGIDLSLPEETTVRAVHEGVVTFAGPFTAYGNLVIVDHGSGAASLYGHLASRTVNKGDRVGAGTTVGLSGRNPGGNPALYFELRIDGQPVDPLQWLRKQP